VKTRKKLSNSEKISRESSRESKDRKKRRQRTSLGWRKRSGGIKIGLVTFKRMGGRKELAAIKGKITFLGPGPASVKQRDVTFLEAKEATSKSRRGYPSGELSVQGKTAEASNIVKVVKKEQDKQKKGVEP